MREINKDFARDILEVITGRGQITFQTFDDSKEKRPKLSKILHGWNQGIFDELTKLNQQGAGVFFMVNEGDSIGRKSENVVSIRALFVDLDGAPLELVLDAGLDPHITVESSPGRFHAYWLVSDCSKEQFAPLQKALAECFKADSSVNDLPRVMRVPGFYHQKGEPFQTRILNRNSDLAPYTVEDFKKIIKIKPPIAKTDTASKRIIEGRSVNGERHNDLKAYIVGRRKAGLDIAEIRTLVESWVKKNAPDAKSHKGLLDWAEQHIEPEATTGVFSDLVRVKCTPVAWRLKVYGQEIEITDTRQLDSYPALRRVIMEQLGIVPPIRTPKAWNNELENLMLNLVDEDMPDDVSPLGMAWNDIVNFCTNKIQARNKAEVLLSKPWTDVEKARVYFRTSDVRKYLQSHHMFIEPRDLGRILTKHGGKSTTLYIKGVTVGVWWLPVEEVDHNRQKEDFDRPVIESAEECF